MGAGGVNGRTMDYAIEQGDGRGFLEVEAGGGAEVAV